jgi:Na+-transporting methylmalonyl-CoA/oxaloacetate decarboxylase gamma subunit
LSITTIYKHLLIDFDNFLILHISKMQCILYMQKADWSYRRRLVFGHDTGKSQIESEMKQRMEAMSFGESLLISLTGLTVVFTVLIVLALATIAIAKIVGKLTGAQSAPVSAPAAAPAASPAVHPVEEDLSEVVAVLQGALSMESGIPVDKLMITSVKRVPDTSDKQQ